jgi:4-hydroxybenzoate polyprenyltransferase
MALKSYLLHLRPLSWPVVVFHFSTGALLASAFSRPAPEQFVLLIAAAVLWGICLNGGTLALNSAFDRDEGDIGYLNNPPPVPPYLSLIGIVFMLGGAVGAWFVTPAFFICYAICVVMSVLYSCPPVRLKAHAGFDVFINASGYGTLTFLAGWGAFESRFGTRILLLGLAYGLVFAGFYPLTQIYQYKSDKAHNDHTFTVWVGPRTALIFSIISVLCGVGVFLFTYLFIQGLRLPGIILVAILVAWMSVLIPWIRLFPSYDGKRGMYNALKVWALTDAAIILLFSPLLSL